MRDQEGAAPLAAGATSVSATGNQSIDGLLSGVKWIGTTITFSFPGTASAYDTDPGQPGIQYGYADEANNGFDALNAFQIAAARAVFDMIASISGLSFAEVSGGGAAGADIRLAESSATSTAWAYLPGGSAEAGDIWFNSASSWYATPQLGTYGFHTFMHEIGHALGLKHGHETGGNGALPSAIDSMEYSVMTYRSYEGAGLGGYTNEAGGYAQTLMIADIAALQHMYGANFGHRAGNTTYRWDPATGELFINGEGQGTPLSNRVFMSLWDGGGRDTYDLRAYSGGVEVDLRAGGESVFSTAQLARLGSGEYASANLYTPWLYNGNLRSLIENVKGGAGFDTIFGNVKANALWGMGARDFLYGGGGADKLFGGGGRDVLKGGFGKDTLKGGGMKDVLIGGKGNDVLTGGAGPDVFRFFAGDGSDTITDFADGYDRIDLRSFGAGFGDLTLTDEAGGVRIEIGNVDIFLAGVDSSELDAGDFIF